MNALDELRNIANAKRENFEDAEEFRTWAQNRARHALEAVPPAPLAPGLADAVERLGQVQLGETMYSRDLADIATLLRHVRSGGLSEGQREAVKNVLQVACDRGNVTWVRSAEMDDLRAAFPEVFEKGGGENV